ncbi:MAG: type I methionyl aminopeptidase [Patescibacteria group bacterium]|nr:type I methionyl aminopeptidase [Patescibacteria group bacterium]
MINIYSEQEIKEISKSGKILAEVFQIIKKEIKTGVSLKQLDEIAFQITNELGATSAFLGYKPEGAREPYQASICASVNNVIVHGFPTDRKVKSGDILKIDFGVNYKGFYSDAAFTAMVGRAPNESAKNLVKAAQKALEQAIKRIKPGNHIGDIGAAIEAVAKKYKVKVIKGLTGHGIGYKLHEDPIIYNYGNKGEGFKIKAGMVFAVEPMFAEKSEDIIQLKDESWATRDGSLSAHFEHTIAVTSDGSRVLTL